MDAKRLVSVLAAAVAGAITIPLDRPGIGWAVAGIAAFALLRDWFGLGAALLLGIGVVDSAGWVFAPCVVAAISLLAVSVVKGRTWRELGFALPRWVWGGWRGFRSMATTSDRHGAVRLARGIGAGLVLVIVFGLLLSSAEQRFADVLRPLLSWPRLVTFVGVALLCLGALHFRRPGVADSGAAAPEAVAPEAAAPEAVAPEAVAPEALAPEALAPEAVAPEAVAGNPGAANAGAATPTSAAAAARSRAKPRREWARLEWAIPVALVDLLFATFAVVQFTVLFGGHDHVLDPHGPTYAQYAWGGFLELASVTVLTLAVVAAVLSRVAPADAGPARLLVGLLCGLTLVIVGSALRRMQLYVEAFGFTRTRLLATAVIVWLGLILLLLLAVWRRPLLPRLTLAAGALVLFTLSALNPDRIVAQTVIGRWEQDGHLDAPYVASLSLDALPALDRLPEPKRSCLAAAILRRHPHRGGAWNEWNAARAGASGVRVREEGCDYYLSIGYRQEGNWTDPSRLR